jgi:hypothetical protein
MNLDEILYGGDVENDRDSILFNSVASIISKWRTFKLLRWVQLLNRLVDLDETLCGSDDIEDGLDFILFSTVVSTVRKWRTFKLTT